MKRNRGGFTLVELMVALVVSGMVILLARELLASVGDAASRTVAASRSADQRFNRRDWLTRAFGSAEFSSLPPRGFVGVQGGSGARVQFTSLLQTSSGPAYCRVVIVLSADRQVAATIQAEDSTNSPDDTLVLADSVTAFEADYLLQYGADARWVSAWVSPVSGPVAVRLRIMNRDAADTLLLRIGARG